jgi:hypothetical protein
MTRRKRKRNTGARDIADDNESTQRALQEIEYYELYVKVDADDDGIAELRRLVYAGGVTAANLLSNKDWDEVPVRRHHRQAPAASA